MIRLALFLLSAVVAGVIFAFSIELPKPKPIDPNNMVAVEVVAPREPVPEPGTVMDVGDLTSGYVHRGYAYQRPLQAPPAPVYERPTPVAAPVVREAPAARQSDPLHYRRYVQETVRQEPPRVYYGGQRQAPRIQQVDPDPYRDRPRTYYYAPEPRREPDRRTEELNRQRGCNAMARWCDQNSRAREEYRGRMQENRGEDFFE